MTEAWSSSYQDRKFALAEPPEQIAGIFQLEKAEVFFIGDQLRDHGIEFQNTAKLSEKSHHSIRLLQLGLAMTQSISANLSPAN